LAEFDDTVYGALSGVCGGRVYRLERPASPTFPLVVYNVVSNPREQVFGSTQAVAVSYPRYQFTCWAETQADAVTTAGSLRTALLAMTVPVSIVNEYQLREPEAGLYRRDVDAVIAHVGE
jgi:hypothetical protein